MTPVPAVLLAALLTLGGCASLAHQANDSFEHTRALADAGDPDAELDLARMYADPAAWPQAAGRQPNQVLAAQWCTFSTWVPPPSPAAQARGPSCRQILASMPAQDASLGVSLASIVREHD